MFTLKMEKKKHCSYYVIHNNFSVCTLLRVAGSEMFSWQFESSVHLPGSATSIGRQFLRCVLHQLAPNQIFNQIFNTNIDGKGKRYRQTF